MVVESQQGRIISEGRERRFVMSKPVGLSRGAKLLIALHGITQRGSVMRRTTNFDQVAEQENLLIIYPDAMDGEWKRGFEHEGCVDDVVFIADLIDYAASKYEVDRSQVYLIGFSNGGFMVEWFVCHHPELLRAAAVVIANLGVDLSRRCRQGKVPSLFLLVGTQDPMVPYSGGQVHHPNGSIHPETILSFDDSVAHWRYRGQWNELKLDQQKTLSDGKQLSEKIYRSSKHSEQLKVVVLHGGGHFWYGKGMPQALQNRFGPNTVKYKATRDIWAFFSSLDLPELA